jgi:hypothetical protein
MLEDCWNTIRDIENAQKLNIELTLKFLKWVQRKFMVCSLKS